MEDKAAIAKIDGLDDTKKAQVKGLIANDGLTPAIAYMAVTHPEFEPEKAARMLKDYVAANPADRGYQGGGAGCKNDPAEKLKTMRARQDELLARGDVQASIALKRRIAAHVTQHNL